MGRSTYLVVYISYISYLLVRIMRRCARRAASRRSTRPTNMVSYIHRRSCRSYNSGIHPPRKIYSSSPQCRRSWKGAPIVIPGTHDDILGRRGSSVFLGASSLIKAGGQSVKGPSRGLVPFAVALFSWYYCRSRGMNGVLPAALLRETQPQTTGHVRGGHCDGGGVVMFLILFISLRSCLACG